MPEEPNTQDIWHIPTEQTMVGRCFLTLLLLGWECISVVKYLSNMWSPGYNSQYHWETNKQKKYTIMGSFNTSLCRYHDLFLKDRIKEMKQVHMENRYMNKTKSNFDSKHYRKKLGILANTCNFRTWEVGGGGSGVHGYSQLHSKLQASRNYLSPWSKH